MMRCSFKLRVKIFYLCLQRNVGGIASLAEDKTTHRLRQQMGKNPTDNTFVRCFPLFSIILAIGNPVIDLFSLDIEGIL